MKRIVLCLLMLTATYSADVVTVDTAGVTTITGVAPGTAPAAGEVKIGGGDIVVGRTTAAVGAQVVRGDDPRLASAAGFLAPAKAATVTNVVLFGIQTIDGVACSGGDRVLVRAQSSAVENGIYLVSPGEWTRAQDADSSSELLPGAKVHINEGVFFAQTTWFFSGSGTYNLGSTPVLVRPENLSVHGTIQGTATFTTTLAKLVGMNGQGSALVASGSDRLTMGIGSAGMYKITISAYQLAPNFAPLNMRPTNFRIYRNGSEAINCDGGISYSDVQAQNYSNDLWISSVFWTSYVFLQDGDYVEMYGRANNGTSYQMRIVCSLERTGNR